MRFAEPFKLAESLSPEEKLEAERLVFMELTQGSCFLLSDDYDHKQSSSLPVGQFDRPFVTYQHDRRTNQSASVYWWRSSCCD